MSDPVLVEASDIEKLDSASAEEVIRWALGRFGDNISLASSFGAEDVVLIHLLASVDPSARIFTLDTGRLPDETYKVMEEVTRRYGVKIEVFFPQTDAVEKMVREHGINLFYDSVELRKMCCNVRKMEPLKRALSDLSAWISGLRREQSVTRTEVRKVEVADGQGLVKVNPLADWTEDDVWNFIRENKVPYNKLHDKNVPSIGCAPCTRPIEPGEDTRAGRWWWEAPEQKECGLHVKESRQS